MQYFCKMRLLKKTWKCPSLRGWRVQTHHTSEFYRFERIPKNTPKFTRKSSEKRMIRKIFPSLRTLKFSEECYQKNAFYELYPFSEDAQKNTPSCGLNVDKMLLKNPCWASLCLTRACCGMKIAYRADDMSLCHFNLPIIHVWASPLVSFEW